MNPSAIHLAAQIAAENALPPEARRLIEHYDALHREWKRAGWLDPVPEALDAAASAVMADPLASIAFELRRRANDAYCREPITTNPAAA